MYIVKVTEAAGQHRITLPKAFCVEHKINEVEYLVIDDRDPENITIGRFVHGKGKESKD
ncbi:hypothetical protein ES702_05660 [subsurface metagenome]